MVNLKLAVRRLLKTPFVSIIAIVSLSLGIGANAAIFSLFDEILMRPLPVQRPQALVNLGAPRPKPGSNSCNQAGECDAVFSYPMFRDLEKMQTVFTGVAAHRLFAANLAYHNQTVSGEGMLASGSYFPVLGIKAALGRLLGPDDDRSIGTSFVTVLSHSYWTTRLGANPDVLNSTIVVNGQSMTIVGVAPEGFEGTTLGSRPYVFVPITMRGLMSPGWKGFDDRRSYWAYLFARLKPGTTVDQARTPLNGLYHGIVNDVEAPLQQGLSDQTMARFKSKPITLDPGSRGQSSVQREAKTPLLFLFAITAIVLLIACANIANLLLARAATRATEMAVRLSIGASRRQLLSQLLTESLMLAVLGGIGSIVVAKWTLATIASLLPPQAARSMDMSLQPSVFWFAAVVSVATGLLFGIFPALHSTRPDLVTALKAQAGQPSGARAAARFRTTLVTAQIALSMALLISAGLFVLSLQKVSRIEIGIQVENLITFAISPELNGYTPQQSKALFERVEDELAALPGVTGVSAAVIAALGGNNWGNNVSVQGFQKGPDTDAVSNVNEVAPGYFQTLGIALLAGRDFARADTLGAPKVAIVNETFAKKFNLGRDAVGKRMATGNSNTLDTEIIGLVKDTKYSGVRQETRPVFFRPYRQDEELGSITFYARTTSSPEQLLRSIPGMMARLDPNLPVDDLKTMPQQVRDSIFMDRMISTLSAAFALLATLLAAVGLYGVLAYTVAQRTREFGLRMALGADGNRVRAMVMRQVGWMTLVGAIVGIAMALGLARAAQQLLYELQWHDPRVVTMSAVVLAFVALGAGFIPAHRASRVDPMRALRYE